MEQKKTVSKISSNRNSQIELLRILSMLAILFCHFATHGNFNFPVQNITIPRLWWNFIEMGGNFGVDIFVLISGYFLIQNKSVYFNLKKTMKLWGQIIFYSLLLFAFSFLIGKGSFDFNNILKTIFPITFSSWWFASTYFVLFLLHPFINKLLHSLDVHQYQKLLMLMTVLWCIIPTLTTLPIQSNQLIEFVYYYAIAGYIRIYGLNNNWKCKHYLGIYFLSVIFIYLSGVFFMIIGTEVEQLSTTSVMIYFYGRNKLPTLLSAISLFVAFLKMRPFYSKIINRIASATFGVYLLHDSNVLREYLWRDIFKNASFQDTAWIVLFSVGVCVLIYVICTVVELLRQISFEKGFMKWIDKHQYVIMNNLRCVYEKVKGVVFGKE